MIIKIISYIISIWHPLPAVVDSFAMGIFNLFKKPSVFQDNFFGQLRFMNSKDSSKNYYEGKGFFAPGNCEIEYFIQADIGGPSEAQKNFYNVLQNNFKQYIQKIKPLIEDEFRNWKEGFKINDFNTEFKLVCITIPKLDRKPLIWEMSFTTIHDLNHQVTIDFVENEPNGILIDG